MSHLLAACASARAPCSRDLYFSAWPYFAYTYAYPFIVRLLSCVLTLLSVSRLSFQFTFHPPLATGALSSRSVCEQSTVAGRKTRVAARTILGAGLQTHPRQPTSHHHRVAVASRGTRGRGVRATPAESHQISDKAYGTHTAQFSVFCILHKYLRCNTVALVLSSRH